MFECLMCNAMFYVFPIDLDEPTCPYCGTTLPSLKPVWNHVKEDEEIEE